MTNGNPEAPFRRRALDVISADNETVRLRLDKTEATVARIADAVEAQTVAIANQSANMELLERAVIGLTQDRRLIVEENRSQRQTVDNPIKLATALVNQRAI